MENEINWKSMFASECMRNGLNFVKFILDAVVDINSLSQYGKTILSYAAECGRMEIVEFLVQKGADVNVTNSDGSKPLHLATKYGHTEIVQFFLGCGVFVDSRDNTGNTPLHYAVGKELFGSYQDVVHLLLDSKADLNAVNEESYSPLLLSGLHAHKDIVELFIQLGVDVHYCDIYQTNVLHYCCINGWTEVVRSLVEGGFNIDLNARNIQGHTPLSLAYGHDYYDIVKLLMESGAKVEAPYYKDQILLHYVSSCGMLDRVKDIVKTGCDLNPKTWEGITPLHMALRNSHFDVAKYLIDSGADITCCDNDGNTALHIACHEESLDAVKYLLSKGLDLNVKGPRGYTPLHFAARCPCFGIVECLVDSGADVYCCDENKMTALHYSCMKGSLDAVKCIVNKGCELDAKSYDKDTPLLLALKYSHFDVAQYLIDSGADVNCSDKDKKTPLHWACEKESLDVVMALTKKGCHLNVLEGCGNWNTPLHVAVEKRNFDIVKHLLESGADCNVKNMYFTSFTAVLLTQISLKGIVFFLQKGGYFEFEFVKHRRLTERIFKSLNLSTLALMNKFNADLLQIYGLSVLSKHLPPFEQLRNKITINVERDIAQCVRSDIQTKGYCNGPSVRPINLAILSMESIIKYYCT